MCDRLTEIAKEVGNKLNSINKEVYYAYPESLFNYIDSNGCKFLVNNLLGKSKRINKINADNNYQWNYVVENCEKDKTFWLINEFGCDFGAYAQENKDVNYCYFLEDKGNNSLGVWGNSNYKSLCIESIGYIKQIDEFVKTGTISDCNKIPQNFYFKGNLYNRCITLLKNK